MEHLENNLQPSVDKILEKAKSLFILEDTTRKWIGNFPSLYAEIHIKRIVKKLNDERFNNLNMLTTYIVQDIGNIITIIFRLSWMQEKSVIDDFLRNMWMHFAGVDISLFHIEIKSIMDYIAEIIAECADKQLLQEYVRTNKSLYNPENFDKLKSWSNIPQKFAGLKHWLTADAENIRHQCLDSNIAKIVETTLWYDEISFVRNKLVHKGDCTLVFGKPEEGILFQIFGDGCERVAMNDFYILENNIASFERYAALYISQLLLFLEQFAEILRHKLSFMEDIGNSKIGDPGFDVLIKWIDLSLIHDDKSGS